MKTEKTYEIYYDEEADLLEVYFGEPVEGYAEEIEEGVFLRKDLNTGAIKSIEIFGFKKRANVLQKTMKLANLQLPIQISI